MKKTFFLFAFLLVSTVLFAQSKPLPQAAIDYRAAMKSFIQAEGFSPTIDEDGSLTFKREGVVFWIIFKDEDPVYIEFHRAGLDGEGVNLAALHFAVNDLNYDRRCVKAVIDEDGDVALTVEFYSTLPADFKTTFYRYMNALSSARDFVLDKYKEYEKMVEEDD